MHLNLYRDTGYFGQKLTRCGIMTYLEIPLVGHNLRTGSITKPGVNSYTIMYILSYHYLH